MSINVRDFMEDNAVNNGYEIGYSDQVIVHKPFEVGDTIYIPYKITEMSSKQTGNTVLKQFKLDGPAINPSRETYTEHRLKEVFEAI